MSRHDDCELKGWPLAFCLAILYGLSWLLIVAGVLAVVRFIHPELK